MIIIEKSSMDIQLSVSILTIPSRKQAFQDLMEFIKPLIVGLPVEILTDDSSDPVWIKRQRLLERSHGLYVSTVDDDDLIFPNYFTEILKGIRSEPDCIGFRVKRTYEGKPEADAIHSIRYTQYRDNGLIRGNTKIFERTPNHLNPIKREIAIKEGFKDSPVEDIVYARGIRQYLNTEYYTDSYLYHYRRVKR